MIFDGRCKKYHNHDQGFTLIELAIVLIIIGLIISGVLVGSDMIAAAKLRSQITQITQFNTAISTFRMKYNCIPGDCYATTSFFAYTGVANGDGNGLITDTVPATDPNYPPPNYDNATGEIMQVFPSLNAARLVGATSSPTPAVTPVPTNFPAGKLGYSGIFPMSSYGSNYWVYALRSDVDLSGVNVFNLSTQYAPGGSSVREPATPYQAYQIDSKMDDGVANAGGVRGQGGDMVNDNVDWLGGDGLAAQGCTVAPAYAQYSYGVANIKDRPLCGLIFRWN